MRCRRVEEEIQEALGRGLGPLDLDLSREARAHLEQCAGCRRAAQELGALDRMLARMGETPPPPAGLAASVLAAVAAAERPAEPATARSEDWLAPGLAAAVAVALLALLPEAAVPWAEVDLAGWWGEADRLLASGLEAVNPAAWALLAALAIAGLLLERRRPTHG